MTVITKANELIEQEGYEAAIKYFQDQIDEAGKPNSFPELCKLAGRETAIKYIKEKQEKQ